MKKIITFLMVLCLVSFTAPTSAKKGKGEIRGKHGKQHEKYRMKHVNRACREKGLKPGSSAFRACLKRHEASMKAKKRQRKISRKKKARFHKKSDKK